MNLNWILLLILNRNTCQNILYAQSISCEKDKILCRKQKAKFFHFAEAQPIATDFLNFHIQETGRRMQTDAIKSRS